MMEIPPLEMGRDDAGEVVIRCKDYEFLNESQALAIISIVQEHKGLVEERDRYRKALEHFVSHWPEDDENPGEGVCFHCTWGEQGVYGFHDPKKCPLAHARAALKGETPQ